MKSVKKPAKRPKKRVAKVKRLVTKMSLIESDTEVILKRVIDIEIPEVPLSIRSIPN